MARCPLCESDVPDGRTDCDACGQPFAKPPTTRVAPDAVRKAIESARKDLAASPRDPVDVAFPRGLLERAEQTEAAGDLGRALDLARASRRALDIIRRESRVADALKYADAVLEDAKQAGIETLAVQRNIEQARAPAARGDHGGAGRPPEGRVRGHSAPRPEGPTQPPRGARPRGRRGRPPCLRPGVGSGETERGRRGPRGYDPGPGGRRPRGEEVCEGPGLREGRPRRGPGGIPPEDRAGGVREPPARRGGHPYDGRRGHDLRREARRPRHGDRRDRPSAGPASRAAGRTPDGTS